MSVDLPLPAGSPPDARWRASLDAARRERVDFRLLGAVEAVVGRRSVVLGGGKQRALLALLVLHANEVVSRDFLIDQLWGECAPASADHALVVYVSRLRKALRAQAAEDFLRTEAGGYVLRVDPVQTDVGRFERALEDGRRALAAGAPGQAADTLRTALAEWRGDALGDVVFEPFAEMEAARLEELRLTALGARIDADLALGRHAELIGELESLVRGHPLNERLRGQLMLALYRSGRQAEALEVYRDTRRLLVDELGIEPGTDLQELEQAILRHDPGLEPPAVSSAPSAPMPPARRAGTPAPRARGQLKTVSVLFGAVRPTALGDRLDPESLTVVMARYVEAMKQAVERHGGTVERFVGDALLGIFGVPVVHEDDALRAVCAASDMRDALASLNEELTRELATALELRLAVNTGRVLTGAEEPLVTGDAVNVAVELGQVARPGEILIGEETLRLVSQAVAIEPAREGETAPGPAYRLIEIRPRARFPRRRLEVAMVGRERRLKLMRDTLDEVVEERSCHLFTIVGAAGVGKSRVAAEFVATLEDVTVLKGRCPAYGEGITYRPVVEVLRQLPDVSELGVDEVSVAAVRALLGEEQEVTSPGEIARSVRKTLEAVAGGRPVVVVLEDIHFGENPFLDLVEHVADLSRDVPILLLCLARSELLERRPGWAGGKPNATTVLLEPLSPSETDELIRLLLGETEIEQGVLDEIRGAAGGNPLFVEEMVALLLESGDHRVTVPPTIEAVLAARLDQLDPRERDVLEAGAVEGQVFHVGAVHALAPGEPQVAARLDALVRKELIRPGVPQLPGEEAFRFRHLLIRDAAYEALPKAIRADLHERYAAWVDERAADLTEAAEIEGYQLEQAWRYRREIAPGDERLTALAVRAGERLTVAGRRAHLLGDMAAAANLLGRARALQPAAEREVALEVELAEVLVWAGRPTEAEAVLDEARARAATRGDRSGELLAGLVRAGVSWFTDGEGRSLELQALAKEAIPVFEAGGNESGLMRAWTAIAQAEHMHCRVEARNRAFQRALVHARRAGDTRSAADITTRIGGGYSFGPAPVDEGLRWLADHRALLARRPLLIGVQASLEAMRGRFDEARALLAAAHARNEDLGARGIDAIQAESAWRVEMHAGDADAAERATRAGCRLLEEMGERAFVPTQAAELALALCALGRYEEAEEWARKSEALAASDDVWTQMLWRQAMAKVTAHRGELEGAQRLAREAVTLAEQTDMLTATGDALIDLAAVLRLAGKPRDAAAHAGRAFGLYERKGNTVMAERARDLCDELRPSTTRR